MLGSSRTEPSGWQPWRPIGVPLSSSIRFILSSVDYPIQDPLLPLLAFCESTSAVTCECCKEHFSCHVAF